MAKTGSFCGLKRGRGCQYCGYYGIVVLLGLSSVAWFLLQTEPLDLVGAPDRAIRNEHEDEDSSGSAQAGTVVPLVPRAPSPALASGPASPRQVTSTWEPASSGAKRRPRRALVTAFSEVSADYIASALILQQSAQEVGGVEFEYVAFVLTDPNGPEWESLRARGWKVQLRNVPVSVKEIKGPLSKIIAKSGCCGINELAKIHIFQLVEYERVVFFDADAMILQGLEELVNTESVLWTEDVGLGGGCMNGGFVALTPSQSVFDGLVATVKKGDFRDGSAWGGKHIGWCYGGQTFQGVVPYYFMHVLQGAAWKALDMKVYNNMGKSCPRPGTDVPYTDMKTYGVVRTVHFTWCQKPWHCYGRSPGRPYCEKFHGRFAQFLKSALKRDATNVALLALRSKRRKEGC